MWKLTDCLCDFSRLVPVTAKMNFPIYFFPPSHHNGVYCIISLTGFFAPFRTKFDVLIKGGSFQLMGEKTAGVSGARIVKCICKFSKWFVIRGRLVHNCWSFHFNWIANFYSRSFMWFLIGFVKLTRTFT